MSCTCHTMMGSWLFGTARSLIIRKARRKFCKAGQDFGGSMKLTMVESMVYFFPKTEGGFSLADPMGKSNSMISTEALA